MYTCRYNDFKHDPLSACNCTPPYSAENAVCARSDLNDVNGTYPFFFLSHRFHGGIDTKVNSITYISCSLYLVYLIYQLLLYVHYVHAKALL